MMLSVEIARFVDNYQPGIVACEFCDSNGDRDTIIEKAPIISLEILDADSQYPRPGVVRCVILSRSLDDDGRNLVTISTEHPDFIESIEGTTTFVVLENQLDPDDGSFGPTR